jgi:hypothetical protein
MLDPLEYFRRQSRMTDPGSRAALFRRLPADVDSLRKAVQGLMIHALWADQYGVQLSPDREAELQLRRVEDKLDRILQLDWRPLAEAREPGKRLAGNCRDYSVMLTAFLRNKGIPARARCGFARYFAANHFEDHWVAEYWSGEQQRWILVDAQLDNLQMTRLKIDFDPLDVPRAQFLSGGAAWQECRLGRADADAFGIHDLHGLWFVRGNLVRDVASLNKMELLPWDSWGIIEGRDEDLSGDDLALLDQVAARTREDVPEFEGLRKLYEADGRLRVASTIRSYTESGPQTVDLSRL